MLMGTDPYSEYEAELVKDLGIQENISQQKAQEQSALWSNVGQVAGGLLSTLFQRRQQRNPPLPPAQPQANYMPFLLIGGAAAAYFLLKKK